MPYQEGDSSAWEAGSVLSNTSASSRHIYTHLGTEATVKQEFVTSNATLKTLLNFGLLTAAIVLVAMLADFLLVPALMAIVFRKTA